MTAWLAFGGKNKAVISHESALAAVGLTDVIPARVHVTVPRSRRNLPMVSGIAKHTTTKAFQAHDVVVRNGVQITSPIRSILDSVEAGLAPEHVDQAILQGVERGLISATQLQRDAKKRSKRILSIIENALSANTQA
jgi:predicted transcriptional regulator of viral defense system